MKKELLKNYISKLTKQDIIKCDLCQGAEIPLCVYNCPSGALELQKEDE